MCLYLLLPHKLETQAQNIDVSVSRDGRLRMSVYASVSPLQDRDSEQLCLSLCLPLRDSDSERMLICYCLTLAGQRLRTC